MARSVKAAKIAIKSKKEKHEVLFPSKYGSHTTMIVEDLEADDAKAFLDGKTVGEDQVVCKDETFYITEKVRVDTGMADPNRMYKA